MRAVVAAALALVASGVASAASAAAQDAPEAGRTAPTVTAEAIGNVTGTLRALGPNVLGPGQSVDASVTVRNTGGTDVSGLQLAMSVTSRPLTSTDDLAAFLDDPSTARTREVARTPEPADAAAEDEAEDGTDAGAGADAGAADEGDEPAPVGEDLAARAATVMNVSASAEDLDLPTGTWGVYGIEVTLVTTEGESVVATGATTWSDDDVPALDVAVLALAQGSDAEVAATLANASGDNVAIAVDPTRLTNAAVFDNDLLERETVRVPAGDPDVTSLAHGDGADLYGFATDRPSGASVLTNDKMTLVAPVPVLDESTLALAADAGATAAVADSDTVGAADLPQSVVVDEASGLPILRPDAVLSDIIAAGASDPAVDGALIAASALSERGGLLVTAGENGLVRPSQARLIDELLEAPWVNATTIANLAAAAEDAPAVDLKATAAAEADLPASQVAELMDRYRDLTVMATATDHPADAFDEWGAGLVTGVTLAGRDNPTLRDATLTTALSGADATLAGVSIAEGSDLNLLADSGDIPVTVMNSLDRDVTVTVKLVSNSPNLIVEDSPEITVGAGLEETAAVPVSAVSTANVTVVVGLETADGHQISPLQSFDIRVRADWGTAGAAVFTGLLALLMVAGVIRTIRRGRKDTRLSPSAAPSEPLVDPTTGLTPGEEMAADAEGRDRE